MDSPASVTIEGLAFVEREPTCRRMEEKVNSWNPKFEGVYNALVLTKGVVRALSLRYAPRCNNS